ncbi:hypothetical protein PIB30_078746, partial [Stylosanthes scabra]|nr:hypothetical protein [Stylosanthes scabra]
MVLWAFACCESCVGVVSGESPRLGVDAAEALVCVTPRLLDKCLGVDVAAALEKWRKEAWGARKEGIGAFWIEPPRRPKHQLRTQPPTPRRGCQCLGISSSTLGQTTHAWRGHQRLGMAHQPPRTPSILKPKYRYPEPPQASSVIQKPTPRCQRRSLGVG